MFWIFLLVAGFAVVFMQLGAVSVWAAVFAGGLRLALLVIAILGIAFLWRKVFQKNN